MSDSARQSTIGRIGEQLPRLSILRQSGDAGRTFGIDLTRCQLEGTQCIVGLYQTALGDRA